MDDMHYEECCRIRRICVLDNSLSLLLKYNMHDLLAIAGLEEVFILQCSGNSDNWRAFHSTAKFEYWQESGYFIAGV